MGGVSHPSQLYAVELLKPSRVAQARDAVERHYGMQRARYGEAFASMGLKVHTGDGGFYHWLELPEGLNAEELKAANDDAAEGRRAEGSPRGKEGRIAETAIPPAATALEGVRMELIDAAFPLLPPPTAPPRSHRLNLPPSLRPIPRDPRERARARGSASITRREASEVARLCVE